MVSRFMSIFGKKQTGEDPVCHMQVDVNNPPGGTHDHEGTTYYFCAPGCRVAFSKEAAAYLSGEKRAEM